VNAVEGFMYSSVKSGCDSSSSIYCI